MPEAGDTASSTPEPPPPDDTHGWWNRASVELFRRTVGPLLRLYVRMRIYDAPRLDGPYVLAANHTSFLDPILLGAAAPRRITYLMTAVIHRSPALGWFYRWMRAIPVPLHGGPQRAIRAARRALARGDVVGIFPEGGISRDARLMLGNPGAVSLVFGEAVPIIPVGIVGAADVLPFGGIVPRPRRVEMRFGRPLLPDELAGGATKRRERLELATARLMQEIARLSGQQAREQVVAEKNART